MCLIAAGPLPDEKILKRADLDNPHGIGVAWVTKKGVQWQKGLDVPDLLKMPKWIKKNCVVHFRLATAGSVCPELTHPFPVAMEPSLALDGVAERVLFHNGHVFDWETTVKKLHRRKEYLKGDMSDSRMLAHMAWRFGDDIMELVGGGQRVLVLSKKGPLMYGDWHQEGERWYSNTSYKYERTAYSSSNVYNMRDWDDEDWNFVKDEQGKWVRMGELEGKPIGTKAVIEQITGVTKVTKEPVGFKMIGGKIEGHRSNSDRASDILAAKARWREQEENRKRDRAYWTAKQNLTGGMALKPEPREMVETPVQIEIHAD